MQEKSSSLSVSFKQIDAFGLLCVGIYSWLSLLPDSSSLLVSWPWVIVWYILLLLPWFWLLKHIYNNHSITKIGFNIDKAIVFATLILLGSTAFSIFPKQSLWYSWPIISSLAAFYSLNIWCSDKLHRFKLLNFQACFSSVFIIWSLWLWLTQTFLPEIKRLQSLGEAGLELQYDFSTLELRNWAPIGHQNYVAGYLVLSLPLLLAFSIIAKNNISRFVWGGSGALGLVALYTTSSRGGWLGLAIVGTIGTLVILGSRKIPLSVKLSSGIAFLIATGVIGLSNNRFQNLLKNFSFQNFGGETAYRLITNSTGWHMGLDHPIFGAGAGTVPLLYQKYRPTWAGTEAEFAYQLHSTPAQIWAEFGSLGIIFSLGLVGWYIFWGTKIWHSKVLIGNEKVIVWGILSGLVGYGVICLTDYQLDVVPIVGTLLLYNVCFISLLKEIFPHSSPYSFKIPKPKLFCLGLCTFLLIENLLLAPSILAWHVSSDGFKALKMKQIDTFVEALEKAHTLAPWEAYYSYQLGWNLGNFGYGSRSREPIPKFLEKSESYLKSAIQSSPYLEFGYNSLGWIQLRREQPEAVKSLSKASQIVPSRKLAFHGLGLSLLHQTETQKAIKAFALELVRHPIEITSPIWRREPLNQLFPQVENEAIDIYQELLQNTPAPELQTYLHHGLGSIYWWSGDYQSAEEEWNKSNTQLGLDLIALIRNQLSTTQVPIFKAWLEQDRRTQWVKQALLSSLQEIPQPNQINATVEGMNRAESFDQWVKQYALLADHWRERSGFGVLVRHIDGPAPLDFAPISENLSISWFLEDLFPNAVYLPALEQALDPLHQDLWKSIETTEKHHQN